MKFCPKCKSTNTTMVFTSIITANEDTIRLWNNLPIPKPYCECLECGTIFEEEDK